MQYSPSSRRDAPPHLVLRAPIQHAGEELLRAHGLRERGHLVVGDEAPGDETANVHLDELGHPHIGAQDGPDIGDLDSRAEQAHRRQAQGF